MRFAVAVTDREDRRFTPVTVEAEPTSTVGQLTARLVQELDATPGSDVYRGSTRLAPELPLSDAGIHDGAALGLGVTGPDDSDRAGLVEVHIVGGVGAGTVYRLSAGDYALGAAPHCRIRLPGGAELAQITVSASGEVTITTRSSDLELNARPLTPGGEAVTWPLGAQLSTGTGLLELAQISARTAAVTTAEDGVTREYNRPPRLVTPVPDLRFRLPRPPGAAPRPPVPLLPVVLLPVVTAIVTVLITGNWRFIVLGLLSPVAALLTRSGTRRAQLQEHARLVTEYEETDARIQADVSAALMQAQHALRLAHPDPAALLAVASNPTDRLWERRRRDEDFLSLRVGTGPLASAIRVEDPTQDEHRRTTVPTLAEVPAAVALQTVGVLGVAGGVEHARWLVAEAAVLHSPSDLQIVVLCGGPPALAEQTWGWSRWLPHVRPDSTTSHTTLGTTTESIARRVAELLALIAARSADTRRTSGTDEPVVLVVLDGARRLRSLPGVISILRDGPAVGIYAVCVDDDKGALPEECRAVLIGHGDVVRLTTGDAGDLELRPDLPEPDWYETVARSLAPLRAVGDAEANALPDAARLTELFSLDRDAPAVIEAGWVLAPRSSRAVIGVGLDGPFGIDLDRDGPHGLIAGTTGSGKSELLQTLVASLAIANRPDEMTFVLIDYKGGSAFAECADLPHTVGMVTDLDNHLVERALVSLGAELRRREHVLADAGAKDLADYVDRRRLDPTLDPLPRLLIVVDEFASMVRELPQFVTGLVNIAQRGRSLGIHMILATQRPSGAVTPDIRANTNLRIALRTTDPSESRDIIDAPDSAEIPPRLPGRAYARLSRSVLLPFQTARVGGRSRATGSRTGSAPAPVTTTVLSWGELGDDAPRRSSARTSNDGAAESLTTDMAVLAEALDKAVANLGLPPMPSPWLPPLPTLLELPLRPDTSPTASSPDLPPATWGMVDLPAQQRQVPLQFDLNREGHLHLLGAAQTGRSQALRTLATTLASSASVRDLHMYGIDCGSGALLALTALPHVGGIVDHRSPERLGRLLVRLGDEMRRRQRLLGARGAADLAELRRQLSPQERPPHIVLIVDRFEVFDREYNTFDNGSYLERMIALLRDGGSLGIHLVLAGDRTLASSRYAGTTESKVALRMNDPGDWSVLGVRPKDVPDDMPPGRGLRLVDGAEVQIGVLPTGTEPAEVTGAAQASTIERVGETLRHRDRDVDADGRPRPFLALPDRISYAEARSALAAAAPPGWALLGVGGDDLRALGPNLADTPTFIVAGPPRSGRSTALLVLARSLLEGGSGLVVLAPRRSPLRTLANVPGVAAVLTDSETPKADLRRALQGVHQDRGVLIVDDAELLLQSDLSQDIAALARGAAGEGWAVLIGGNADALGSAVGGWIAQARRNRYGVLLTPQSVTDGELLGIRLGRGAVGVPSVPGRGLLHLGDGALVAIQIPDVSPEDVDGRHDPVVPDETGA